MHDRIRFVGPEEVQNIAGQQYPGWLTSGKSLISQILRTRTRLPGYRIYKTFFFSFFKFYCLRLTFTYLQVYVIYYSLVYVKNVFPIFFFPPFCMELARLVDNIKLLRGSNRGQCWWANFFILSFLHFFLNQLFNIQNS